MASPGSIALLSLALLLAATQPSFAQRAATRLTCASAAGIKTEAEVKYIPSQGIYTVDVTFIVKRPRQ